jgi:hypothetical protein
MAQRISQKVVNTFVKGLITEAGELTFPEDASVDELNCLLSRDGSRRRRLGVKVEDVNADSTFTVNNAEVFTTGEWTNVGGKAGLNFLVVQAGSDLYFYNTVIEPYSAQQKGFSVDLSTFEHAGSIGSENAKVELTTINGDLVVVSEGVDPFYVTYDSVADTVATTQITPKVRDFEWQGDTSTYYTDNGSPSQDRKYDAQNTGWNTGNGAPSDLTKRLTHPWYAGRDADGNYDAAEWAKIYTGNTLTGNGHYVLEFFSKNRQSVSGLSGLTQGTEVEEGRFKAVAAFSGRVFYSGLTSAKNAGKILYTKQLDNITEADRCYQQNDPTSEDFSDLLDTDGGVIVIPDATNIQKLHVFGSTLLAFAENGVWQISGVDGVFRSTQYSVSRVSEVGISNAKTFVSVEGVPIWWSKQGIHTLSMDSISSKGQEQNLSISTIQSFFDLIDNNAKNQCESVYDKTNKRVHWFYPNNGESLDNKKSRVLTLDIAIQSFYPWEVTDKANNDKFIIGSSYYSGLGSDFRDIDVITSTGDDVVTTDGDDVIVNKLTQVAEAESSVVLMIYDGASGKMTMGLFAGTDFLDWGESDYSSYAEAGYDYMGDLLLKKNAPYIQVYLRPTETGFDGSSTAGFDPIRESGLLVSSYWDFRTQTSSNPQQAYRLKYMPIPDPTNLAVWDYPENVVTTRLKMRGRGRNMRLRFQSEQGKDFVLLGFGVINAINTRY